MTGRAARSAAEARPAHARATVTAGADMTMAIGQLSRARAAKHAVAHQDEQAPAGLQIDKPVALVPVLPDDVVPLQEIKRGFSLAGRQVGIESSRPAPAFRDLARAGLDRIAGNLAPFFDLRRAVLVQEKRTARIESADEKDLAAKLCGL